MSTLVISLSDGLRAFVDAQVTVGAFETPSAFFEQLVREAQDRREQEIDTLLQEALDSQKPSIRVTPVYWDMKRDKLIERISGNP